MGITIEDGKGKGFTVGVTKENHLQTDSFTLPRVAEVSQNEGQAYSWSSRYNIAAGSTLLYLRNVSTTKNLIIDEIDIGATSGATWELWTSTTNGAGTIVSGINHNLTSSNNADTVAFGDENVTSNSSGVLLAYLKQRNFHTDTFHSNDSIILGQNDAILVKKSLGEVSTTSGICTITGYFQ